jgi:hypothetical protein
MMPPRVRRRGRKINGVWQVTMKTRHVGATRMDTKRRGLHDIKQQSNIVNGREERKMDKEIQEVG